MTREPWVDTQALVPHLNKSAYTIRRWAQTGIIPGVKKGRGWMFQLSAVDAALTAQPDPWLQSPRSRGRKRVA